MPKITEINQICQEIGRDKVYYEPEIQTDIMPDGKKVAKVVVRVYADRNVKEESGIIPWEVFTNKIYFDIKDLYENAEETGFKEIAEVVANYFNKPIQWSPEKPSGDAKRLFSMERANSYGFYPKISIKEGVESTIEWYLNNQDKINKQFNALNK